MICKGLHVSGNVIDSETRCAHYHTELDIIAIKFYCCDTYFPCFQCHEEAGCGNAKVWPIERFDEKAVLCGCCGHELTINEYLAVIINVLVAKRNLILVVDYIRNCILK